MFTTFFLLFEGQRVHSFTIHLMRLKTTIIIVLKVETVGGPKAEESGERGQPAPAAPACLVCWGLGPNSRERETAESDEAACVGSMVGNSPL